MSRKIAKIWGHTVKIWPKNGQNREKYPHKAKIAFISQSYRTRNTLILHPYCDHTMQK